MSLLSRTLIGASIPFLLVVLFVATKQPHVASILQTVDIGVEHRESMTLEVTVTSNDLLRMVTLKNDALEPIALSVPTDWKRGEVRNVPLKSITADEPSFGYVRWHLPANASVSYTTKQPFQHLSVHNPSGIPLKIRATLVDLLKNTGEHQVYLVQEGSAKIP